MPKIYIASKSGFCFGVCRAIKLAEKINAPAFSLGELIHNPQMINKLEKRGIRCISSIGQIPKNSYVIIRAHGVADQTIIQAKKRGLKVINATCPYVSKVQVLAKYLAKQGYQVIILGEKNHPEVKGIAGNLKKPIIVSNLSQAKKLKKYSKIGFLSQTTQSHDLFQLVYAELKNHAREIKGLDTICDATNERQAAAKQLAKKMDLMIIIGGRQSGNTKRLYEICRSITKSIKIETAAEIDSKIIKGKKKIGITAGASTPDYLIRQVVDKLKKII